METDELAGSLQAALDREAAMREVLQTLNRSRDDEQAVFDVILDNALRFCDAQLGLLFLNEEGDIHQKMVAQRGGRSKWVEMFKTDPTPLDASVSMTAKAALEKTVVQIADLADTDLYRQGQHQRVIAVDDEGVRTCLAVPLIGECIHAGTICMYRREMKPFTDSEVDLVRGFAEHAVSAIENARQTREIQTRLEREQATREILQVISRSRDDGAPVFDLILQVALKLCDAEFGGVCVYEPGDTHVNMVASRGMSESVQEMYRSDPPPMDPSQSVIARCILNRDVVHVDLADPAAYPGGSRFGAIVAEEGGLRTTLHVPMVVDDQCVGALALFRFEPNPFADDRIELLQTFAAQAAIAVENVRTFKALESSTAEVRTKADALVDANSELNNRLEREQATREILQVVSQSRDDEKPVFDVILANAMRLCNAPFSVLFLGDGTDGHPALAAYQGTRRRWLDDFNANTPPNDPELSVIVAAVTERRVVRVPDMKDTELYRRGQPNRVAAVDYEGVRSVVVVPLLRESECLGGICLYRRVADPFCDEDIALLETFAAQAVIAIENVRQFRELQTRLEREEATSEILGVISQSQQDSQGVFDVILENAVRLCQASNALLMLADEDRGYFDAVADYDARSVAVEMLKKTPPPLSEAAGEIFTAFDRNEVRQIEDLADTERYRAGDPYRRIAVDEEGIRTLLIVPLVHNSRPIGCLMLYRRDPRCFDENHVDLVRTFAAQAVIAIQNVRQFRAIQEANDELAARLEREEATREVLQVISRSRDDEQPVFDVILEQARRLCGAPNAFLWLRNEADTHLEIAAHSGARSEFVDTFTSNFQPLDDPDSHSVRAVLQNQVVQIEDLSQDELVRRTTPQRKIAVEIAGMRTLLIVPLSAGDQAIGSILLYRREISLFSDDEINMVKGFAAQAVIAIENVRQFRELQTRLEREEASAEILQIISQSREDEVPVFDAIIANAARLCNAPIAFLSVANEERTQVTIPAHRGTRSKFGSILDDFVEPITRTELVAVRPIAEGKITREDDIKDDEIYRSGDPRRRQMVDVEGARSVLSVPLIQGTTPMGAIVLYRREVQPFSDDEINMVKGFAAQAVIAIENVRQFRAIQEAKTALEIRLEREAATRGILEVISQSRADDTPVFDAILESACRLCDVPSGTLFLPDESGTSLEVRAEYGLPSGFAEMVGDERLSTDPSQSQLAHSMHDRLVIRVDDLADHQLYRDRQPHRVHAVEVLGMRSVLYVPLVSSDHGLGVMALYRREVKPFTDSHVELLQTFAAQAVIAIENVNQFRELQTRLEREEATGEILSVISQSREDENPVFYAILNQASRLCDAPLAGLILGTPEDTHAHLVAHTGGGPEIIEMFQNDPPPMDPALSIAAQAIIGGKSIHLANMQEYEGYLSGSRFMKTSVEKEGIRTGLWVPLLSNGRAIGVISVYRQIVQPFTEEQITLVETFAEQAVIAIENSRQFRALVEARDEAEAALADLKKAQERLVQSEKMASLGQLTAGIAHEIKNPLNFVNNFAKLSDELLGELGEALEDQINALDQEEREDAEDLFQTVRENLKKINEHGRRADSIIKNMLLHSRVGPAERQRVTLNPIASEALNLAYHGARAENSNFNVEMNTDLAEDAGEIDCYPQDLMRVFLNLISNGMYAAYARSLNEDGFVPVISLASRLNGDRVEVEVRDNGMGIPEDMREQIFTPFFTTKPAGEGTGLGLSLSYDIVVKQHGGDLTVESEPGKFTIFKTSFPRYLPADFGGNA